ncbi:MAG: electron transfer flavoprotein subunit alpha [Actinobacteria bacterium]|nr:electron transfer flavoprotein subunit alpha [Actinomycetota bacterium]
MEIKVDEKTCTGCSLCKNVCMYDAIEITGKLARINDNCIFCGACIDACKFKSIEITGIPEQDFDFSGYEGVMVFIEQHQGSVAEVSYELLSEGRKLADTLGTKLYGILPGYDLKERIADIFCYGIDRLYIAENEIFKNNIDDIYSKILVQAINRYRPDIFLGGATSFGRTLLPKVAAIIKTGLTADCTELSIDPDKKILLQTRPTFGGNILATIITRNARPQMATVRPHVMAKAAINQPDNNRTDNYLKYAGKIEFLKFDPLNFKTKYKLLSQEKESGQSINLTDYDVIVSGGRGIGGPDNFALIKELADVLGGVVGASRAAVDSNWISYPHQVGQTGKTVNPKVYIACGISGAIQHLAGMQTSDIVIAINKDPYAPIFKIANYGLVGDLFEIIPRLIKKIKSGKSSI